MVYRIDVFPAAEGNDPIGVSVRQQIAEFGTRVGPVRTARIFLIDTDAGRAQVERIARELLADPVVERAHIVDAPPDDEANSRVEIHLKPGVMDPVAHSTETAIARMGLSVNEVRTGRAFLIEGRIGREELSRIASRVLANGVIESVHFEPYLPREFSRGHEYTLHLKHVRLRDLDDRQLQRLSRDGHLFLSLAEMKTIQDYFRRQDREPTDIELETIAQTWSEHCVHKTLKSAVEVEARDEAGKTVGRRRYGNLIKETIFQSTMDLMKTEPHRGFCLSVFADNAGVVAFDETDAVCFKVETHNHPSAIEPYGGSATGAGGVIRDVLGTGLAARPVANTDVFCVADPHYGRADALLDNGGGDELPRGVIHPRRILQQVVAGVRDYGNRMGIPTLNGAVYFDNRYLGNPLVFCGCVGIIPRDKIHKQSRRGDAIVVMGGRTGRDGIHGATFSSAELTDTHADEFSHAVQIGDAITEKKMTDVILQARDRDLFTAVTDCGAGGLSSAVGEMGEKIGATVELDKVPLKYAGLRYDEIWISEAQERMVLSVPQEYVPALLELAAGENVEATVIGTFGTEGNQLILNYAGHEVGRLDMAFLHGGIPMPTRKAVVAQPSSAVSPGNSGQQRRTAAPHADASSALNRLLKLLAHPNIASKHWIIRQYDHEVQGGSVVKPLIGPMQRGPSDAAVIRPKLGSNRGLVLACGLQPAVADPYAMAIASIDEAVRNAVAVGADPDRLAILDNFCWPSVDDEITMGTLVRACEACRDAALAYRIPFISGKDSLHNQFTNSETGQVIRIPNTLLISAMGVIDDVRRCVTMDFKRPGSYLCLVSPAGGNDGLANLAALHRALSAAIRGGAVLACHDVSDGSLLVAAAEMAIASGRGVNLSAQMLQRGPFDERNGRYLVEVAERGGVEKLLETIGGPAGLDIVGRVSEEPVLRLAGESVAVDQLAAAWLGTLDW